MGVPIVPEMEEFFGALRRPRTYWGYAVEAYNVARFVAWYPLGVVDAAIRPGRPSGQPEYDTPVLLVHGFGHNRSGWFVLERHLRTQGFTSVHTWNYNPFLTEPAQLAERLADRVELLRQLTGAERVHIVGHSLGGVLLRWYVQELGGADTVHTAITVASPHEGTAPAAYAPGPVARALAPDSWFIRRLQSGATSSPVRWIAYYSNLDALVQPARSAMINAPALAATNILAKDLGHLSIMLAPKVVTSIGEHLAVSESTRAA